MAKRIKADLVIEAYRTDDGGLFIAYSGIQPPEMVTMALEVAEQIQHDFLPDEDAADVPF